MKQKQVFALARSAGLVVSLSLALGGCTYDYLQHSDRISYRAGDAVKANLARETTNPSKKSMNSTSGLGKNGSVIPAPAAE
jgi:hypothetical protein